jgi:prophage DNA circulation protein
MSWENETKEFIKCTSPEGNVFEGLWIRDDKSNEKKLGIFSPPKFNGDIIQDMGVKSDTHAFSIYFQGLSHHRTAQDFDRALKETGQWEIIHPVDGPLILQLVSWQQKIDPISSGNVTEFTTTWLEPANQQRLISAAELSGSILSQVLNTIEDAQAVLQQLRADLYADIQALVNAVNQATGAFDKILTELTATNAIAQDAYTEANTALANAINTFGIGNTDPSDIAEALAEMAIAPLVATEDFVSRLTVYQNLSTDLFTYIPSGTTSEDYNKCITQEYTTTLSLIAVAQIVATSDFASRSEVISAMENIQTLFDETVEAIETAQDNFSDLDIDEQYFSQTKTYTSLINLYTLCFQYLLTQFYNLAVEKVIVLDQPRSPLEITVTEYGELGDNDENYELLIKSNHLTGMDILLLAAGREVVIYV